MGSIDKLDNFPSRNSLRLGIVITLANLREGWMDEFFYMEIY